MSTVNGRSSPTVSTPPSGRHAQERHAQERHAQGLRASARRAPARLRAGGRAGRIAAAVLAGAALVAAAGVVLAVSSGGAADAATAPGVVQTGRATMNSLGDSGLGNCAYPPEMIADRMYTAAPPGEYDGSGGCGTYLDVTGSSGRTVRVLLADKCPECEPGHLDMSPESFRAVAAQPGGVQQISYTAVRDPVLPGPIAVQVQTGSSEHWIGFLIMNHGNPLTGVEYRDADGEWHGLTRTVYNYWHREDGAGPGPFTLRLTDAYGHQRVVDGIESTPDVTQHTDVWMYQGGTPAPDPSASSNPASVSASGSGSGSEPPAPASSCSAEVTMAGSWPDGYQAVVRVRNDSASTLRPWRVAWTVAAGVTVTTWNGDLTQQGTLVTLVAPSWNDALAPGQTAEIGHVGTGSPVPARTAVELNGQPCAAGLTS